MPNEFVLPGPVIDLSALDWQFGSVAQRPWQHEPSDGDYDLDRVGEWLPASVPGNVRSDLLALGRIDDPLLDGNLEASRWTEGLDWWYRARLPLGLDPGQRAFIELDGVDYLCAVFVEGRELGRHEGMFNRQTLEVPPDLAQCGSVELAVRIWGSDALPAYPANRRERLWGRIAGLGQSTFLPFDDRLATLKRPMSFGWDFAPRLRTMGIWDEGRLLVYREVSLADLHVHAEPSDSGPARVTLRLETDSLAAASLVAEAEIEPANFAGDEHQNFEFSLRVPAGRSRHTLTCELPAARLWQPWERGAANLYRVRVRLCTEQPVSCNREVLAGRSARFGVRSMAVGDGWQVHVNGQPFFLRGVNWAPVDALPGRAGRARYEPLLRQAVAAGANFVRVWGGGGREKQAFYDLCDELGLLVWQEFPIACVFLDHLPRTAEFDRLLRQEAGGIVRSLRNHPGVFLWCGGNEFSPSRNRRAVETMADTVASEDGHRPFVPASPGDDDAHNWLVWHGLAPLSDYRKENAAMASEFGLQAAPCVESLREFIPEHDLWPAGAAWQRRNADLHKLRRYAQWFQDGDDGGLAAFVTATQRAQAAGLQVMIEHVRRRKGKTGGLALWQWNEPWPSICWSVIDYAGRPKLACETLRRIMQPVLVSLDYQLRPYRAGDRLAGALWVVNDMLEPLDGCTLRVLLDGVVVQQQVCSAGGNCAARAGALAIHLPQGFCELVLELRRGNEALARNVYDLRFHDGGPAPAGEQARRRFVDLILR